VEAAPKFELAEWLPVIRKLVVLVIAIAGSFGAGSLEDSVTGELRAAESAATEGVRAERILDTTYETLQDYVAREAACDTALEMYRDPEDFEKVLEECHSDGGLE